MVLMADNVVGVFYWNCDSININSIYSANIYHEKQKYGS